MVHERVIEIVVDGTVVPVQLNGTKTVSELLAALPLRGDGAFWGDEIYFDVDVGLSEENPRTDVEMGDVAYWLPGTALCLFFGRTPASTTNKPRGVAGDRGRPRRRRPGPAQVPEPPPRNQGPTRSSKRRRTIGVGRRGLAAQVEREREPRHRDEPEFAKTQTRRPSR